jgi:hypothetical protein
MAIRQLFDFFVRESFVRKAFAILQQYHFPLNFRFLMTILFFHISLKSPPHLFYRSFHHELTNPPNSKLKLKPPLQFPPISSIIEYPFKPPNTPPKQSFSFSSNPSPASLTHSYIPPNPFDKPQRFPFRFSRKLALFV